MSDLHVNEALYELLHLMLKQDSVCTQHTKNVPQAEGNRRYSTP